MQMCRNHPDVIAPWKCTACGNCFCDKCCQASAVGPITLRTCQICGERVDTVTADAEKVVKDQEQKKARNFFNNLPTAFAYPFKGSGIILLILGGIFFWLGGFVRYGGFFGFLGMVIVGGYLCAYMIKIINSTANGDDEMPDWPDFADFLVDIVYPYFLLLGVAVLCLAPGIVYLVLAWFLGFGMYWIGFILMALGLLYMPMGVLCVAIIGSVQGLSPAIGIPALKKTFGPYMAALGVLAIIVVLRVVSGMVFKLIPILGSAIDGIISFYFIIVEMRILGLLYYAHEDELNWFEGYAMDEAEKEERARMPAQPLPGVIERPPSPAPEPAEPAAVAPPPPPLPSEPKAPSPPGMRSLADKPFDPQEPPQSQLPKWAQRREPGAEPEPPDEDETPIIR